MLLKVTNYRGSRKIFSMCKIENAAGGAKLHHPPPQDRVKAINNMLLEKPDCFKNVYQGNFFVDKSWKEI